MPHAHTPCIPPAHIRVRRAYEAPQPDDGVRLLVDRLWPRGLTKQALALDDWPRALAPSTALRQWFGHDPTRWEAFQTRYRAELAQQPAALAALRQRAQQQVITLVYAAHDSTHNNAIVLRDVLLHP